MFQSGAPYQLHSNLGVEGDFGACGNDGRQIEDVNELISTAACFDWPAVHGNKKIYIYMTNDMIH